MYYQGSPYTGNIFDLYRNNQVLFEAGYKDGLLDGTYKKYYSNGNIDEIKNYKSGILEGPYIKKDDAGLKVKEGNYKSNIADGKWKHYFGEDEVLIKIRVWKSGKRSGIWKSYYLNGNPNQEVSWEDSKKNGIEKSWYENGELYNEVNYKEGYKNGLNEVFYDNGQVELSGNWNEGRKYGTWKKYNKNGQLIEEIDYTQEYASEHYKKVYENGILIQEGIVWPPTYDVSLGDTLVIRYDSDGSILSLITVINPNTYCIQDFYKNTNQVMRELFYDEAEHKEEINITNEKIEGYYTYYYYDDDYFSYQLDSTKNNYVPLIKEKGKYSKIDDGAIWDIDEGGYRLPDEVKKEGIWTFYYQNGSIKKRGKYSEGKKEGVWKYYKENGQLDHIITDKSKRKNFNEDGTWDTFNSNTDKLEVYDPKGQILSTGPITEGGTHVGLWKYYNIMGEIKEQGKYNEEGNKYKEWEFYDENGYIKESGEYFEGKRNSNWKYYNRRGQIIKIIFDIKNNAGKYTTYSYYANGGLRSQSLYYNSLQDSITTEYYKSIYTSNNFVIKGNFSELELKSTKNYVNGINDGEWNYYYKNGIIAIKENWINNKLDKQKCFKEKNGKKMRCKNSDFFNNLNLQNQIEVKERNDIKNKNEVQKFEFFELMLINPSSIEEQKKLELWSKEGQMLSEDWIYKNVMNDDKMNDDEMIEIEEESDDEFFMVVENMPEFPGGDLALMKFIQRNVQYPDSAKVNNITGKVYIGYIVDRSGSVTNVKIVRGVDKNLDAEAVRVVKSLPKYKPGYQRGKLVRVMFTIPINFTLN